MAASTSSSGKRTVDSLALTGSASALQQCAPGVFPQTKGGMQLKYFGSKAWFLSLLFVKSQNAHSASSEVIIQQMCLQKFVGFARCALLQGFSACFNMQAKRVLVAFCASQ